VVYCWLVREVVGDARENVYIYIRFKEVTVDTPFFFIFIVKVVQGGQPQIIFLKFIFFFIVKSILIYLYE